MLTDASISKDLLKVNEHMKRLLKSDNVHMQNVIDYVLESTGKQLRPHMLLLFSKIGKKGVDATEFAAILEIIHMASLVHDDIIDDADTRRGRLSVQKKFGKHMAVYTGDYMLFAVIRKSAIKPDAKYRKVYDALTDLYYGELGQEVSRYNIDVTIEDYLNNITGKTATMFELACELGAMIASPKKKSFIEKAALFGRNVGILFQIRDDLLDFMCDDFDGKPTHADFINGVYTLPLLYTLENDDLKSNVSDIRNKAKESNKDRLDESLANELMQNINKARGFDKTKEKAHEYYSQAIDALNTIETQDTGYVQMLIELIEKLFNDIHNMCMQFAEVNA